MITVLFFILILVIIVVVFMQQPKFGKTPRGKRLELIKQSPHFKKGRFENLSFTPDLTEGATYYSVLNKFLFQKKVRPKPAIKLPSIKTNLHQLEKDENVLVWFGHSSYFMQVDGSTFLVDPVLSGAASPIKFTTRSFDGTDVYIAEDIPAIDYLIVTHDHWDHLDYETIIKLKSKIRKVICGLGVGEHFEHWGFNHSIIAEHQWYETILLEDQFIMYTTPARHFSGRGV